MIEISCNMSAIKICCLVIQVQGGHLEADNNGRRTWPGIATKMIAMSEGLDAHTVNNCHYLL